MAAELRLQTVADGGAARRDLAATRAELSRYGTATGDVGTQAERSRGKLGRFGSAVGLAARSFGPLAAVAGAGLLAKFGVDAIRAASDTQQAMGAIDAVFGKSSRQVKQWATDAATSVGLAKSEYGNLAVVLGSMLKNQGIKGFAGQTKELISLGSDLAAQYGGSTKDAVEAIGSLMRGEADPIERYGVSIKQSGINAVLAARGQSKLTGAARTQAEAQARLSLLTRQTASAQGAFKRESNTLAGAQQRLTAKFTNLKSTLGSKLLPIGTKIVQWLLRTISGSNKTAAVMRQVGAVIRSYVTPIIRGATAAWRQISAALSDSRKKGDGFGSAMRAIGKVIRVVAPIIGGYLGFQLRLIGRIIGNAIRMVNGFVNAIRTIVSWCRAAASAVGSLINALDNIASHVPHISLPHIPGLGRSADAGLIRGVGRTGSGAVRLAPSFQVAPTINLTIGRREIRAVVVEIVQGELREQWRRAAVEEWA